LVWRSDQCIVVDLSVVYDQPSQAVSDDSGRLTVALSTLSPKIGGLPVFFDGWVGRPRLVAALLLSIGAVARARYFMPASPRLLDPVLTSGDELLRIEAFSSCCGVYARVDLHGDHLGEASIGTGTTNVDLGQEIRDALARVDDTTEMRLSVGRAGLRVTTRVGSALERKVKLPVRWVKGLGEARAKACLETKVRVYDLRHAHASWLLANLALPGHRHAHRPKPHTIHRPTTIRTDHAAATCGSGSERVNPTQRDSTRVSRRMINAMTTGSNIVQL